MTEGSVDLLVAGGGVFGLWVARRAAEAGLKTLLLERRRIGSGASGGVVGALSAHTPDRWNPKKDFQFRALAALEDEIARLEAETGLATGYGRIGRAMPIRKAAFLAQLSERAAGAAAHWREGARRWGYERREDAALSGWLSAEAAPLGYVADGFAARVAPLAYLQALRAAAAQAGVAVLEGRSFLAWSGGAEGRALLSDGSSVAAGAAALTAGFESFAILKAATGADLGGGTFGQAALFRVAVEPGRPLLYDDGIYVIPHDDGTVAVGSTDRKVWAAPDAPDPADVGFLERARALCPALAGRAPERLWAGVRPKAWTRDPLVGRLPGAAPVWAATGGFKIGFGIAHRIASALVDRLTGAADPTPLPESFTVDAHLAAAARRSL